MSVPKDWLGEMNNLRNKLWATKIIWLLYFTVPVVFPAHSSCSFYDQTRSVLHRHLKPQQLRKFIEICGQGFFGFITTTTTTALPSLWPIASFARLAFNWCFNWGENLNWVLHCWLFRNKTKTLVNDFLLQGKKRCSNAGSFFVPRLNWISFELIVLSNKKNRLQLLHLSEKVFNGFLKRELSGALKEKKWQNEMSWEILH